MPRAGFLSGLVMFFLVLLFLALSSPLYSLLALPITNILAGYLNGVIEKDVQTVVRRGGYAGAMSSGFGAIVILIICLLATTQIINFFNISTNSMEDLPKIYEAVLGVAVGVSLINLFISIGLGMIGGLIWKKLIGKRASS